MKRIILLVLMISTVLLLMAGCTSKKVDVNTKELADKLLEKGEYTEQLMEIPLQDALRHYKLDSSIVTEGTFYKGTSAVADEIAVIKSSDSKAVNDALSEYRDNQIKSYESYRPDEVPKLENGVLYTYDNTVIYCISEDSDAVMKVITDYTAK